MTDPDLIADDVAAQLAQAVIDLCWHVQPYGTDEDGWIGHYIVSSGPVHRLVGAAQAAGISAALRATEPWLCLACQHPRPHHRDDHARCHCGCPMYLPGDDEREDRLDSARQTLAAGNEAIASALIDGSACATAPESSS
jgi:hypothetical protein